MVLTTFLVQLSWFMAINHNTLLDRHGITEVLRPHHQALQVLPSEPAIASIYRAHVFIITLLFIYNNSYITRRQKRGHKNPSTRSSLYLELETSI